MCSWTSCSELCLWMVSCMCEELNHIHDQKADSGLSGRPISSQNFDEILNQCFSFTPYIIRVSEICPKHLGSSNYPLITGFFCVIIVAKAHSLVLCSSTEFIDWLCLILLFHLIQYQNRRHGTSSTRKSFLRTFLSIRNSL